MVQKHVCSKQFRSIKFGPRTLRSKKILSKKDYVKQVFESKRIWLQNFGSTKIWIQKFLNNLAQNYLGHQKIFGSKKIVVPQIYRSEKIWIKKSGQNPVSSSSEINDIQNTSLAALGALAYRLRHLTARSIQNGRLELGRRHGILHKCSASGQNPSTKVA